MTGTDTALAHGEHRTGDKRHRRMNGPSRDEVDSPFGDLVEQFTELALIDARGARPTRGRVDGVRRVAVGNRLGDRAGLTLGIVAALATRYDDPSSRGWLPTMLAEHGRFEEAAALLDQMPDVGAPGWPRAKLVTALWQLGRHDDAGALLKRLRGSYPDVLARSISVWDEGPVAAEYARRLDPDPVRAGRLPAFLHLPFSGGTSMVVALKNVVPWRRMVEVQRWFGLLQVESALALSPEEVGDTMLVHLHHAVPFELPERQLSWFTVLRDPVSQMRSGFYKRRSTNGIVPTADHGRSQTLAEHVEFTTTNGLTNMLARQIVMTHPDLRAAYDAEFTSPDAFRAITSEEDMFWFRSTADLSDETLLRLAKETLDERFHLVGTMRHLGASHLAASAAVGLPVTDRLGHRGKSGQPSSETGGDAVHDRLRAANWVDQQLYDDYTARFERDHADLIEALDAEER